MKKVAILFILTFMLIPVSAQEENTENTITYGDSVEGEITNRNFEVEYAFEGAADDIINVQLIPEDESDGLNQPSIILLDADFRVIQTVDGSYGAVNLFYNLPNDGQYYILATRRDGRSGDSEGAYTLNLFSVEPLAFDTPIEDAASNTGPNYYAVRTDESFDVQYIRGNGDFYPEVAVNIVESDSFSDSNLSTVAKMEGDELQRGLIGVDVTQETIYIIRVGPPLFNFSFTERDLSFTIEVNTLQSE